MHLALSHQVMPQAMQWWSKKPSLDARTMHLGFPGSEDKNEMTSVLYKLTSLWYLAMTIETQDTTWASVCQANEENSNFSQVPLDTKQRVAIISFTNKAGKGVQSREGVKDVVHVLNRQRRETGGPAEMMWEVPPFPCGYPVRPQG